MTQRHIIIVTAYTAHVTRCRRRRRWYKAKSLNRNAIIDEDNMYVTVKVYFVSSSLYYTCVHVHLKENI